MECLYFYDMTYSQVGSSWLPFGTRFVGVFALAVVLDFSDHHTCNRTCRMPLGIAVGFAVEFAVEIVTDVHGNRCHRQFQRQFHRQLHRHLLVFSFLPVI